MWLRGHRVISVLALFVTTYAFHHSIYIFRLSALAAFGMHAALALSLAMIVTVELLLSSPLSRVHGLRGGWLDEKQPVEMPLRLKLDYGRSVLRFRIVQEGNVVTSDSIGARRPLRGAHPRRPIHRPRRVVPRCRRRGRRGSRR